MPTIPALANTSTPPPGAPGVFSNVDAHPEAFGALQAQALAGAGENIGRAGDMAAQHAIAFQQQQNITSANDAYATSFSPSFRQLYGDYYALQGKDAVDRMPEFVGKMQDLRQQVREGLPNDQARRLFDDESRRRVEMELDGMSRYADQQNKVWRSDTHKAFLKSQLDLAADKDNDEQAFGSVLGTAQAEIDRYTASTGGSAEQARAAFSDFAGAAMVTRVERQLQRDPMSAQQLYRDNIGMIPAEKRPVLEHQIRMAVTPIEAKMGAEAVMRGMQLPQLDTAMTIAGEPLISAVIARESGGNPAAVSAKGARGVMQIMPDTARQVAGEMGLEYDEGKLATDANYQKTLGTRYLQNMLAKYGGNQTLALAAYNAGPGRVDAWLKTIGDPTKGEISDQDFAAAIPIKETRDYVANVNAKAPQGAAAPTRSADMRANLASWIPAAERYADTVRPGDVMFRDQVVAQVRGYVNTMVSAQEGVQRQAHQTLIALAMPQPGGAQAPTTLDDLLTTPEAKQAWLRTDSSSQRGILALLDHNARAAMGTGLKSDPNVIEDLFARVHLPDDDPNKIRQPGQLTPYFAKGLSRGDYDWLRKEIDQNQTEDGQRLNETRNNFLAGMKAQFTHSTIMQNDPKGDADFYNFRMFVMHEESAARAAGKPVYELFNPNSPTYLGKQIPAFQRTLEQRLRDMASDMKRNQPAALPPDLHRRAGESIDDYLKRTKP